MHNKEAVNVMIIDFIKMEADASLYIRQQHKAADMASAKKRFSLPIIVIIKRQFILYNLPENRFLRFLKMTSKKN